MKRINLVLADGSLMSCLAEDIHTIRKPVHGEYTELAKSVVEINDKLYGTQETVAQIEARLK